jgi:sulfur-oxidizing protein SoxZ
MRYPLHIKVPVRAARGEAVRIQAKLNHPMESGWRKRQDGSSVPKSLAGSMVCSYGGREVFRADMDSGTASDPYLAFYVRAENSGIVHVVWTGEAGERFEAEGMLLVN